MSNKNSYYITTTLPYVNSDPHLGFALEIVQTDALARYHRLLGKKVFFNFGTDEHGLKVYNKAIEAKKDPQEYADEYAKRYDNLKKALNLSYDNFIRTTDPNHIKAAQEFWKLCDRNGDIYKKKYKAKYCIGCELEKTDSELTNGKCPIHPSLDLEIIEEENYFFRFSKYQKYLLDLYKKNPDFVIPAFRQKEIVNFVSKGLKDFSISRLSKKLPWGIPVPGDPEHVMYVWFDALINYISAIGWPSDKKKITKWWPVIQVAGKDNLRQQSAIWQAMLASADLPASKQILIHGFISSKGQRISKSLGNVVDPYELVEKYGTDALRYYILAKFHPFEDSDFTIKKFEHVYQSDLANGLGNFVNRVVGLTTKYSEGKVPKINKVADDHPLRTDKKIHNWKTSYKDLDNSFETYEFHKATASIWKFISAADKYIDQQKPWELAKNGKTDELNWVIYGLCEATHHLAWQIAPILPDTSIKIAKAFGIKNLLKPGPIYKDSWTNIKPGTKVELKDPLFPRLG